MHFETCKNRACLVVLLCFKGSDTSVTGIGAVMGLVFCLCNYGKVIAAEICQ